MSLTYQQALGYIHSFDDPYLAALRDHGQQTWGLDRIRDVLALLGNPHLAVPIIHVAGTKGKGSTAAFITQGLIAAGLKTGLYISPHLQDWRERIQIDRQLIEPFALARLVEDYQHLAGTETRISAFEVTTALAFLHFARQQCDAAVIEVGLGGRLDATNVVQPLVSVITSISLDHTQLLGSTLSEIAAEKAAIIKPGVPVVSAPQHPEAQAVIVSKAQQEGSSLTLVGRDVLVEPVHLSWQGTEARIGIPGAMDSLFIGLPGEFQLENAATSVAALRQAQQAGLPISDEAIRTGLATVKWPGRLEIVSRDPLVIVDSAHNPYSMRQLVRALEALGGFATVSFVFGSMADKDVEGMLEAVVPAASRITFTQGANPRAASPVSLLVMARTLLDRQGLPAIELAAAADLRGRAGHDAGAAGVRRCPLCDRVAGAGG
jgi:dihydrofolate synthase/folylpolyglutamate synthase